MLLFIPTCFNLSVLLANAAILSKSAVLHLATSSLRKMLLLLLLLLLMMMMTMQEQQADPR